MQTLSRTFVFCIVTLFVVALAAGCKPEAPAFQVNDIISDPGAFSGSLAVVGIVYAYAQDDATLVGIMDKKELQCTTPNCKKVLLPVKVAGARPAIGDEVEAFGALAREPLGYLLRAERVQVLASHNLGVPQ
ncbi:MAG: hypothetical protein C0617_03505 [Desulfuromonas sp.]|uniref:hypothetical protein n=1 Tax=Desulfuromonas sp. TaxID=892 RepID=UPI000CA6C4E0|nr:hypothetical protein [Desulfuromonas sp.]PLX85575.1 MAG: hypothetical protein C0617_03505 [Desulfuromonas sp.]